MHSQITYCVNSQLLKVVRTAFVILVGEIQNNLSDLYIDHPWRKLIVTQYPYHLVFFNQM